MHYLEIFLIIVFGIFAVSMGVAMLLAYRLFNLLKKNHIKYYKSIGEPIVLIPINLTSESYTQALKGGIFGYAMVFRGIHKNFPKDIDLRKLAQAIRITLAMLLVLFVTLVIVVIFSIGIDI